MRYSGNIKIIEMLRVFTSFSGYDSQCLALRRLDIPFELVGWSEIDKYAIQAHDVLFPEAKDRNYGDISKIDWAQVPHFDLFTYSFPCTDLSCAGQQKGLAKGSGTRSSLLWECEKAIRAKKPKYLLMENVSALISQKFLPYYEEWRRLLVSLGYESWSKVLNATDYGVPQNRERIFMVSILGGGSFYFPEPMPLDRCLGDVLEDEVDERYFLSEKALDGFHRRNTIYEEKGNGFRFKPLTSSNISPTLKASAGYSRMDDIYVKRPLCLNSKVNGKQPSLTGRVYSAAAAATAVTTGFHPAVLTPRRNAYGKTIRKDYESGIVKEKRGNMTDLVPREDGLSNTITTVQKDNSLYIPRMCIGSAQKNAYKGNVKEPSPTITAACGMGGGQTPMVILQRGRGFNKGGVKEICPTISTSSWQHNNMVATSMNKNKNYIYEQRRVLEKSDKRNSGEILSILRKEIGEKALPIQIRRLWGVFKKEILQFRLYEESVYHKSKNESEICSGTSHSKGTGLFERTENESLRNLRFNEEYRCASQRWKLSEQFIRELNDCLQELPHDATSSKIYLRYLRRACKRPWILQQALYTMEEIWESFNGSGQDFRIRKLTVREVFRLMDMDDSDIDKLMAAGISNTQLYKMAGNSIVVNVLYHIFRKMFVNKENENIQLTLF